MPQLIMEKPITLSTELSQMPQIAPAADTVLVDVIQQPIPQTLEVPSGETVTTISLQEGGMSPMKLEDFTSQRVGEAGQDMEHVVGSPTGGQSGCKAFIQKLKWIV